LETNDIEEIQSKEKKKLKNKKKKRVFLNTQFLMAKHKRLYELV